MTDRVQIALDTRAHLYAHTPLLCWRVEDAHAGILRGVLGEYVFTVTVPHDPSSHWQCTVVINAEGKVATSYGVGPEQAVVNAMAKLYEHVKGLMTILRGTLTKVRRLPGASRRDPRNTGLSTNTGDEEADMDNAHIQATMEDMLSGVDPDTLF